MRVFGPILEPSRTRRPTVSRREPARLQQDQLGALRPGLVEQGERHARGLARTGWRDEDGVGPRPQRGCELVQDGIDGELRVEGAHDASPVARRDAKRKPSERKS
jgi:hypothetical protein